LIVSFKDEENKYGLGIELDLHFCEILSILKNLSKVANKESFGDFEY
jgi:hypothetical protein